MTQQNTCILICHNRRHERQKAFNANLGHVKTSFAATLGGRIYCLFNIFMLVLVAQERSLVLKGG